jgi:hypothetical protein
MPKKILLLTGDGILYCQRNNMSTIITLTKETTFPMIAIKNRVSDK